MAVWSCSIKLSRYFLSTYRTLSNCVSYRWFDAEKDVPIGRRLVGEIVTEFLNPPKHGCAVNQDGNMPDYAMPEENDQNMRSARPQVIETLRGVCTSIGWTPRAVAPEFDTYALQAEWQGF